MMGVATVEQIGGVKTPDGKMTNFNTPAPGVYDLSEYNYRRMDGLNASVLKEGLISALHMNHAIGESWKLPTDAMRFGSAVHAMVLQPESKKELIATAPINPETKKPFGVKSLDFRAASFKASEDGAVLLTPNEYDQAVTVADAVLTHPESRNILRRCKRREQSVFWKRDGVTCKGKIDAISDDGAYLVELKTTKNIRRHAISRQIQELGYDVSMAWYLDGVEAATGKRPEGFLMIFVEKVPPYAVAVYQVGARTLLYGKVRVEELWAMHRQCTESRLWPGPTDDGAEDYQLIDAPKWALDQLSGGLEHKELTDDEIPF